MIDAAADLEVSHGPEACAEAAARAHRAVVDRDIDASGFWGGVVVILSRSDTLLEARISMVDPSRAEAAHERLQNEATADGARNIATAAESAGRVTKSMNDARDALRLRPRQSRDI